MWRTPRARSYNPRIQADQKQLMNFASNVRKGLIPFDTVISNLRSLNFFPSIRMTQFLLNVPGRLDPASIQNLPQLLIPYNKRRLFHIVSYFGGTKGTSTAFVSFEFPQGYPPPNPATPGTPPMGLLITQGPLQAQNNTWIDTCIINDVWVTVTRAAVAATKILGYEGTLTDLSDSNAENRSDLHA